MGRVVVGCAQGNENPDAVVTAYLVAGAALDRGDEVVMWLLFDPGRPPKTANPASSRPLAKSRASPQT